MPEPPVPVVPTEDTITLRGADVPLDREIGQQFVVDCSRAAGPGAIVRALEAEGLRAVGSDIATGDDFLECTEAPHPINLICVNPPFKLAPKFIRHALGLMQPQRGMVATLTRIDFDRGKTRADIFDHPAWAKKIVLRDRILWFEGSTGRPSENHCWLIHDRQHRGWPTIRYARNDEAGTIEASQHYKEAA
jgi:hypothetical protein